VSVKQGFIRALRTSWVLVACLATTVCLAEDKVTVGVWGNYQYLPDDEINENAWGEIGGEALIIYADGKADEGEGRYRYSAELRIGPGSFTDVENNSTGDQIALHKAWVGWQLNDEHEILVGKSQVPFGWKTINFWPGDILLAGYGDQMDVGAKVIGERQQFEYAAAFYLADDWGPTSTDTLDDNAHWGSSTTFRKVQTWVGDLAYNLDERHAVGISLQAGGLQDLTGTPGNPVSGDHSAAVLYYEGTYGDAFAKASYITMQRELPGPYRRAAQLPREIENQRLAAEVGYGLGDWLFYLDVSAAKPGTEGSEADTVYALAPGARYDYGPGWVYIEFLTQNGFVDRNGRIGEGDFDAVYISLDFYL
jgi:hypothetical protein